MPSAAMRHNVRASCIERLTYGAVALSIGTILAIAIRLTPAAAGFGTHKQLGLKDCAWVMWFKKPCMTCGMTTSFAYAADGRFPEALRAQPAGLLLSLIAAVTFWICLHSALTGSIVARRSLRGVRSSTIVGLVAILALAWLYKYLTWPNS